MNIEFVLYLCPNHHRGNSRISTGITEAFAKDANRTIKPLLCQKCGQAMTLVGPDAMLIELTFDPFGDKQTQALSAQGSEVASDAR